MGIEDLEVVGEDGHEAAALGGEARQHAAEVEAQRVVLGRVDQPDAAHDHLRDWKRGLDRDRAVKVLF